MLGQIIWWSGITIEAVILARALFGKLLRQYPAFYAYVLFVWMQSLLRFSVHYARPQLYSKIFWITEWLGVLVGCAVVFEIYRVGLRAYPGTARLARNVLAFVLLLAFVKATVETGNNPLWWSTTSTLDLELALRVVQVLALVALVALFLFYAIPFGRNLRGILLGYGLFLSESVVWLSFVPRSSESFRAFWSHIQASSYFVVLAVWALHLWAYVPNPEPKASVLLEEQYQRMAAATNRRLQEARGYLAKAVRP
jgi:hypothetical protein